MRISAFLTDGMERTSCLLSGRRWGAGGEWGADFRVLSSHIPLQPSSPWVLGPWLSSRLAFFLGTVPSTKKVVVWNVVTFVTMK